MSDFIPYEATHRIKQLYLVMTIVNAGQGEAVAGLCRDNEAYFSIIQYGKGTAPREFYSFSSAIAPKKEIVISILREDKWPVYRSQIKERFGISEMSKGISFAIPLDAIAGVSIYKMLSNTRQFEKPINKGRKKKHE